MTTTQAFEVRPYNGPLQPMPRTDLGDSPHTHGKSPRPLFLAPPATRNLNAILADRAVAARLVYLILWKGPVRVPRGARIGDWKVAHTQHGLVTATLHGSLKPIQIGTYSRIQDLCGKGRDINEMLVYLDPMIRP